MADKSCAISKLKFKGTKLYLEVVCKERKQKIKRLFLRYRSSLEKDVREYEGDFLQKGGKTFVFSLDQIPWTPLYYDFIVEIMDEQGNVQEHELHYGNFNKKVRNPFYQGEYVIAGTDMFVYPYIHNEMVSLCYRKKGKFDTVSFRLREILAVCLQKLCKNYLQKKRICLIYEKYCFGAQDNGYYFFKYCMEQGLEEKLNRRIFYVIDRQSPDYPKMKKYSDHVLNFMSIRHMIYTLSASLLVSTDSKEHVYAWRKRNSIFTGRIKKKPLVFLQHGVIALKRVENAYAKGTRGECSRFIVSSEREKNIIHSYYGYDRQEIVVTGLARWDALKDKSKGKRQILFMATWRNYLDEATEEEFVQSRYFKTYLALLKSEQLKKLLKDYDANLKFYVHNKFKEYAKDFLEQLGTTGDEPVVSVMTFEDMPLNELMMESNLLVTDYSSVSFDMFYQNKPVVFYQFDSKEYLEAHGSYLDFEKELFGERVTTAEELLPVLETYLQTDFALKERYQKMRKECFAYTDQKNCERIAEIIRQMK